MTREEFVNYILDNLNVLFKKMNSVFNINNTTFEKFIKRLILSDVTSDKFYSEILNKENLDSCFCIENIIEVKRLFDEIKLDDKTIEKIIVSIPEIFLFSNKINSIFPLLKAHDFKGYVLLNKDEFRMYNYLDFDYYNDLDKKDSVNGLSYLKNNSIVLDMLNYLSRKDIKDYYKLNNDSSLEDRFLALSSKYDKRNYYFYKKCNPIYGLIAKHTTKDQDGYYYCDLCKKKDEDANISIHYIFPLENGGKDEVYNIACLCPRCRDVVMTDEGINTILINQVRERIKNQLPDYLNKYDLYFGIFKKQKK